MEGPQQRPRSKSAFSFKSDKSHGSNKHEKHQKSHLRESAEEKRRSHLTPTTKANPNAAMNEAQPIAAALEKPTIQSLRSVQHVDAYGKPISDPDLSNPTRNRWERPLDTIRSFEAAIDNEYRRRAQTMRPNDGTDIMSGHGSRRSSYYGGAGGGYDQPGNRFSQFSANYGGRGPRDSWAESGHGNGYGPTGPQRPRFNQQHRMQAEPMYNRYNGPQEVYPNQGYQQSRDTVNTGGSNGSQSDPYSHDPSDNSSIERPAPAPKQDLGEQYGFQGFGRGPDLQGPIMEEYGPSAGPGGGGAQDDYDAQNPSSMNAPPAVPAKNGPMRSNGGQGQAPPSENPRSNMGRTDTGKRKSWLRRRFSKD